MRRVLALMITMGATVTCTQLIGVKDGQPVTSIDGSAGPETTGDVAFPKCAPGFESCGGQLCDTDVTTSTQHCGGCGKNCGTANTASVSCVSGACAIGCAPGFSDCDGDPGNGCETKLGDANNCGACGHSCLGAPCLENACTPVVLANQSGQLFDADDDYAYLQQGSSIAIVPRVGTNFTVVSPGRAQPGYALVPFRKQEALFYGIESTTTRRDFRAITLNGLNDDCLANANGSVAEVDDAGLFWTTTAPEAGVLSPLLNEVPLNATCDDLPRVVGPNVDGRFTGSFRIDGASLYIVLLAGADGGGIGTGTIARVDRATGAVTTIVPTARPSGRPAFDDKYVYWIDTTANVNRAPKAGCGGTASCVETVFTESTGLGSVSAIEADGKSIYVLATDTTVAYLQIVDAKKPTNQIRYYSDSPTPQRVVLTPHYVVWAMGQKVYEVAR